MRWGIRCALLLGALLLLLPTSAGAFGPLGSYGGFGSAAGQLDSEVGNVAVDAVGNVYVADYGNNRVVVFARDGSFLRAFGRDVAPGGGDVCLPGGGCQAAAADESAGGMDRPRGLELGPDGNLYVGDTGNRRIDVFTPTGEFLFAFGREVNAAPSGDEDRCTTECRQGASDGTSGAISSPYGLDFDAAGGLYVADQGMHRIAVFDADGQFLRAFGKNVAGGGSSEVCTDSCQEGEAGSGPGEMREPADVAAGPGGLVAVADKENNRVDVFTGEGAFVDSFGAGVLDVPESIEVDAGGTIHVGEWANRRISEFRFGGEFVRAFGEGVSDGAAAFQICAVACLSGGAGSGLAAVRSPSGIALDCEGALYVSEWGFQLARVVRFGEPGTSLCGEAAPGAEPIPVPVLSKPVSNRIRFNRLKLNRRNGTAVLFVRVAGPGRVILKGRGVRRLSRGAPRAKVVRLPIKPKVRLKRFVKRHGKGRIRVEVTFRPVGGVPRTIEKAIVLRRKR